MLDIFAMLGQYVCFFILHVCGSGSFPKPLSEKRDDTAAVDRGIVPQEGADILMRRKLVIAGGGVNAAHAGLLSVHGRMLHLQSGRPHLDQMREMMLRTGGRAGIAHHLHRDAAHHKGGRDALKGIALPGDQGGQAFARVLYGVA